MKYLSVNILLNPKGKDPLWDILCIWVFLHRKRFFRGISNYGEFLTICRLESLP